MSKKKKKVWRMEMIKCKILTLMRKLMKKKKMSY